MINFTNKKILLLFALFILSFSYIISIFTYNKIIIDPHDNLDIGPIYASIISKIYRGNFNSIYLLQAEQFRWFFLDKIFYPINFLSFFLESKIFYFSEEILKKIISFFSFSLLSRCFTKHALYSILGAILYTTLTNSAGTLPHSYFIPFAPYLSYLLIKKEKLNFKYSFLIFFISLNSSLIFDYIALIIVLALSILFKKNKIEYKLFYHFFIIFSFGCFLSALPMFLTVLNVELHREGWEKSTLKNEFLLLIDYFKLVNVESFFKIPLKILLILTVITSIYFKNIKALKILILILFFIVLKMFLNLEVLNLLFVEPFSFLKGLNLTRLQLLFPLLISLLFVVNLDLLKNHKYIKSLIIIIMIFSTLIIESRYFVIETSKLFLKKNLKEVKLKELKSKSNKEVYSILKIIFQKNNYKNTNKFDFNFSSKNTFDQFYRFDEYQKLKYLINDKITISIGLDPMIAAMNEIKIADGYYTLISKEYKQKFRKIISNELDKNELLKQYFDEWGSRLYVFFNDKQNILVNFEEAKKLNVSYVISSFEINNKKLLPLCAPCNSKNDLYLYKIQ